MRLKSPTRSTLFCQSTNYTVRANMDWGSELEDCLHSPEFFQKDLSFSQSPPTSIAKHVLLLTLCFLILYVLSSNLFKLLNKTVKLPSGQFPGPKPLWLIGNSHQLWSSKDRLETITSWCLKYGPYFMFQLATEKVVVLNSPDYIQKIWSSSDNAYLQKSLTYQRALSAFFMDGLLMQKADKWKIRRKVLSKAFTFQSFVGYMHIYNKESRLLVQQLTDLYSTKNGNNQTNFEEDGSSIGKPINHLLWNAALRIICETTMGLNIMDQEGGSEYLELTETLEKCKNATMVRLLRPWLWLDWIWYFHPEYKILNKGINDFEKFTRRGLEIHKKAKPKEHLTPTFDEFTGKKRFRSMMEEMISSDFDDNAIIEELKVMISAGYESSATSIQFLLFLLALNPRHQELCREEVDKIFEDESLCPDGNFTYESLSNLKYLERCIYETLRLYPVAFFYMRTLDAPIQLDAELCLPKNTTVAVIPAGIHRNPKYYPDPYTFNPDRFLPENCKDRSLYAFMAFSAGPRNCIGNKFAMLEMKVTAARIIRHFDIQTSDKLHDVPILPDVLIGPERGYNFVLSCRQHLRTQQ